MSAADEAQMRADLAQAERLLAEAVGPHNPWYDRVQKFLGRAAVQESASDHLRSGTQK